MSFAFVAFAASAAMTAVSAAGQNKAARNAAEVDEAVAQHNAAVDRVEAAQIDLDTQENIRTQRQEDAVYLSRQAASYAASGVLAGSGSALHTQVTNAGRMEQRIQQEWVNSQQKEAQLYSNAAVGIAEGEAQASADRMKGTLALIDGGAKIAGMGFAAYSAGMFVGGGSDAAAGGSVGYQPGSEDTWQE